MSDSLAAQRRHHELAHDGERDFRLVGLVVVAGRDRDDEMKAGHDDDALAAIAEAGDPGLPAPAQAAEPPLIAVVEPLLHMGVRREGLVEPVGGHQLALAPAPALEDELAELREVAGAHPQA